MSRIFVVALALALLGWSAPGLAQRSEPVAVQRLVDTAAAAYEAGDYERALTSYQRAHELSGVHNLLYMVARCQERLGRLAEALATFRTFLAGEGLPPEARGKAEMAVSLLEDRLGRGRLVLQVHPFGAEILVDDAAVGQAPLEPLELAVGRHRVLVRKDGHLPQRSLVEVEGGRDVTLVIELTAVVAPEDPAPEPPSYAPWTWISLGAGVALAAAGTTVYLLGEADHGDVEDAGRAGTMTLRAARDLRDEGDAKKLTGYVLWGVGGAALIGSATLFVLEATEAPSETISVGVAPGPGGGFLSLQGRF